MVPTWWNHKYFSLQVHVRSLQQNIPRRLWPGSRRERAPAALPGGGNAQCIADVWQLALLLRETREIAPELHPDSWVPYWWWGCGFAWGKLIYYCKIPYLYLLSSPFWSWHASFRKRLQDQLSGYWISTPYVVVTRITAQVMNPTPTLGWLS